MKKALLLSAFLLSLHFTLVAQMVLVFDTNLSAGTTITLPLFGEVSVTVDWGDGNQENFTSQGLQDHTYAIEGEYTVSISGSLGQFGNGPNTYSNAEKLIGVISFGDLGITSLFGAFNGASNLTTVPNHIPSGVTMAGFMFHSATAFNQNIGQWDVSNVTYMSNMFSGATNFNQYIGQWDVSNVKYMSNMFSGATNFNQNIGHWDVSNVTTMWRMFHNVTLSAANYNSILLNWSDLDLKQGVGFSAGNSKYSSGAAAEVRQIIIDSFGWAISDGGVSNNPAYLLWLSVSPSNAGTTKGHSQYEPGDIAHLDAYPSPGWIFSHWVNAEEETLSTEPNFSYTMLDAETTLTAIFEQIPLYPLSLAIHPETAGKIVATGELGSIEGARECFVGEIIHFNAYQNPGFFFTHWTYSNGDTISINPQFTYIMPDSAVVITAHFGAYVVGDAMELTFNTNLSEGTSITLPLFGIVDVTVDWGDGNQETFTTEGLKNHTYATEGVYTVSISGSLESFGNASPYSNAVKMIRVTSFGELGLVNLSGAFLGATNLTEVPSKLPSDIINLSYMFRNAKTFNQDVGGWDVSNVTSMRGMFTGASAFNQNIGAWNVSKVTNMDFMFSSALMYVIPVKAEEEYSSAFNQDIGNWDVNNVTNMQGMFFGATSFNQDIGEWDVSNVTDMGQMFIYATAFNQDIGRWDVKNVTDMRLMFYGATSFNQHIGGWDVSKVLNMSSMFMGASAFNQDIGGWDVGNVNSMKYMFRATPFNQDIGEWDVSNVSDMKGMFYGARNFNQNLEKWDVSNVTTMQYMFFNSVFNQNIGAWDVSKVKNMSWMFYLANQFNQDIGSWNVSNVTNMQSMFHLAYSFNQDISRWNVNKVTNMETMFGQASSFNQDIGGWDVSNVSNMTNMLSNTKLSTALYNNLLIGWSTRNLKHDISFHAGNSMYSPGEPANARDSIIEKFNWIIIDGGITNLPALITLSLSEITPESAISGGEISNDGGFEITDRGVVWGSNPNPVITDNAGITNNGSGLGAYESILNGLDIGSTYYVRAYATNSQGTDYGNTIQFRAAKELNMAGNFTIEDKVYDGTNLTTLLTSSFFITGILDEYEDVFLDEVVVRFDDAQAGNNKTVSIATATLQGMHKDYYRLSLADAPIATASITPKPLTVANAVAQDKIYDGEYEVIISGATLDGVVMDDDVALLYHTVGFLGSVDVGNDLLVQTGMELDGTKASNYTLEQPELTVSVVPRTLAVINANADKVYDATTEAVITNATLQGVVNYDDVTLTNTTGTFASSDAGTDIPVSTSMLISGSQAFNYILEQPENLMGNITPRPVSVDYAVVADKTYDGNTDATIPIAMLGGVINNDDVELQNHTTGTFASSDAAYSIAVNTAMTLGGSKAFNYTLVQPTHLVANIWHKTLNLGGTFTVADKLHDGTTDATITNNSLTLLIPVEGDDVALGDVVAAFENELPGVDKKVYLISAALEGYHKHNYILTLYGSPVATASITTTTDVNEINQADLRVYPNPFTSHIKVESSHPINRMVLVNISGQAVEIAENAEEIHVGKLEVGVYFLRIEFMNHPPQVVKVVRR